MVRAQGHSHINAGAIDSNGSGGPNQGDQLFFSNGASFVEESGFVQPLEYEAAGMEYGGMYTTFLTFSALAATPALGGPQPNHAALGSFIELEIVSVEGPEGGAFGFWEYDRYPFVFATPSKIISAGTADAGVRFDLTDYRLIFGTLPPPGEDPFGHVHDRAFSVNLPGTYRIRFKLFDGSTNGTGGGPIHTAGATFTMLFEAPGELNPAPGLSLSVTGSLASLTFPTENTKDYMVFGSTDLRGAWLPVGPPFEEVISGTGGLGSKHDDITGVRRKFYKLMSRSKN